MINAIKDVWSALVNTVELEFNENINLDLFI